MSSPLAGPGRLGSVRLLSTRKEAHMESACSLLVAREEAGFEVSSH